MRKNQQGLVTVIYILIIALIATLILIVGQSRLLLALSRTKSATDSLLTSYQAEYEINDLLVQLAKGTLSESDFGRFPIRKTLDGGNLTLTADGKIEGGNQILTVTAKRSFAVSKIQAVRAAQQANQVSPVDLVLMIDCTGSMREKSGPGQSTTRMQEAKKAMLAFIDQLAAHPNGDFVRMGLGIFSEQTAWLKTASGQEIRPENNISFAQIRQIINTQFNSTREDSPACNTIPYASTNVGIGYIFMHEYFAQSTSSNKKVEILITDGEPNRRSLYPACPPNIECVGPPENDCPKEAKDFVSCALTEKSKKWDAFNFGVRDASVTAFGITVLSPLPADVRDIFVNAIGASNYFNAATADQLSGILDQILDRVIASVSSITISRVIPLEEE